jgi:hypothetical protein
MEAFAREDMAIGSSDPLFISASATAAGLPYVPTAA